MRTTLALFLLSTVAVTACSLKSDDRPKEPPKKSSSVPLVQMNGSYGAFSDGTKLELFVAYISDGFLLLRDGDTASVDVNGTAVPLTERIEDDKVHYIGELASPPREPVVTVTFVRGGESVVGKVRIAPAFELKAPPSAAKLGDTVAIDIDPRPNLEEWKGALGPLIHHLVEVHGDCIDEEKQQKIELCAKDSPAGTCTIAYPLPFDTSKILVREGATGCEVDVQVRLETGAPPGEGKFGGGVFEGLQHRRFKLALTK
jgi:hypothetical protein